MYISYSKEHQDFFTLSVLNRKRKGTYVEIGAAMPIRANNTYLLETQFEWRGVSVDHDESFYNSFNMTRSNPCVCKNAEDINYDELFTNHNLGTEIDFLQIDIDPASASLDVLKIIDFNKYTFSVVTFEHNLYLGCESEMIESRKILSSLGYTMVVENVMHDDLKFEDWYIKEDKMESDVWKNFIRKDVRMNGSSIDPDMANLFQLYMNG